MSNQNIDHPRKMIESLKLSLGRFTDLLRAQPCTLAYAADLPFTIIDGPPEAIYPSRIIGTPEEILEQVIECYLELDYVSNEQHEKNTLKTVGLIHLEVDDQTRVQITNAAARLVLEKFALSTQIKKLTELQRQKLKRSDPALNRINFQQATRPPQLFSRPVHSASFTWLAHSSTIKQHSPQSYLTYLRRLESGLQRELLEADPSFREILGAEIAKLQEDIALVSITRHDKLYVRREVPPHPKVRVGTLHSYNDNFELQHHMRSCSIPLITFTDEALDELPTIRELGICEATELRKERRTDMIYQPLIEHRNLYTKARRSPKRQPVGRTATRLVS